MIPHKNLKTTPKTGLKGLAENWQSDLIAAVSVSLVALPLGLGIAIAAGAPPISGLFAVIIGGIVTTFYRGGHIAINGPGAGMIAVVLGSVSALDDGTGNAFNYVLAAFVVSGGIQVLLGLLRLGRLADIVHSSVIQGILAAIGIIIFAKQIHVTMGTNAGSTHVVESLKNVFVEIPNINPYVAIISLMGLIVLIGHSKIRSKVVQFLPAPMWVLLLSLPFVFLFDFMNPHTEAMFGIEKFVGPDLLITIPDNLMEAIAFPNFSQIGTLNFWTAVISITMITSIESLASAKAIDKLDPYKRKTDLNKDLTGVGLATLVSAAIGGLPVTAVIVRSTVNIHNHGKTKWANFYHGILVLIFVFLAAPVIQKVPLAALAILLVFTGFKLASPKVFKKVADLGFEQILFFVGTLVITLYTSLLFGLVGGLALALLTHMIIAKVPVLTFFKMIFRSGSNLTENPDGSFLLSIKGIANFVGTLKIENLLKKVPEGSNVRIDFSGARLVDLTIQENVCEFQRTHALTGGEAKLTGLENHSSTSSHKLALKVLKNPEHILSKRAVRLKGIAEEMGYNFKDSSKDRIPFFQTFYFFTTRPIETKNNCISGKDGDLDWEISDITFENGTFMSLEDHKTTLGLIKFPFKIPKFTIEDRGFIEKYLLFSDHKDIDYEIYHGFSDEYLVKVKDSADARPFLTEGLKQLLQGNDDIHHLESNGEAILIFNDRLNLAKTFEYSKILDFKQKLGVLIKEAHQAGKQ